MIQINMLFNAGLTLSFASPGPISSRSLRSPSHPLAFGYAGADPQASDGVFSAGDTLCAPFVSHFRSSD